MREVILSSDGEAMLCLVPDAVAENLEDYCRAFAENWLWQSPHARKYRRMLGGVEGVVYTEADFIDYLNRWVFPEEPSRVVRGLKCPFYDLPEECRALPRFNF